MRYLCFDWNTKKAKENMQRHKVSFNEAATTFFDVIATSYWDELHSDFGDERFINIGWSSSGRPLFVVYSGEDCLINIISARRLTRSELVRDREREPRW